MGLADFKKKVTFRMLLKGIGIALVLGFVFYRSYAGCICMAPVAFIYCIYSIKNGEEKKRKIFNVQLRDGMNILYTHIASGQSLIMATENTGKDLKTIYNSDAPICRFFGNIKRLCDINTPIDEAYMKEAERVKDSDAIRFARIISVAKRSGGNISEIIMKSASSIAEKITIEAEMETLIAGKKREFFIMCMAPLMMILYMSVFSKSVIAGLYDTPGGRMVATIGLVLYIIAVIIGNRMVKIKV